MRAVFKSTRDAEDEDSFSAMLCNIIERECARRESLYNGGERFTGGEKLLARGRPFV